MTLSNQPMSKYRQPTQCQTVQRNMKKPTKFKMNRISMNFLMTIAILALLPYSSTLSLPNGDPAPGRSPGPPELDDKEVSTDDKVIEVGEVYDETTTSDEVEITTVSEVVSERTVDISDACAFARIPSDSDDIVTLSDNDSDVNLTLSHPVFETDELVRGVVYDAICSISKERRKEIFDMYPDDIMGTEIDDLYERRLQLHQIPNQFDDTIEQSRHNINATEVNATTEAYPVASISPEIAAIPRNVTLAQIKRRRLKQQLERFLETDLPSVSDYMNNDDPTNLTKQFDKLVAEHRKRTRETRREIYFSHEYSSAKRDEKVRVMAMAEHFVYATRYKLVLYQVMRNKYYGSMKFRLGFLFALLRHLKNLQKWLYWSFLEFRIILLSHELKLLFKVMRLDLDIRYVVRLIQKVDYKKNMLYDPGFYNLPAQKRRK